MPMLNAAVSGFKMTARLVLCLFLLYCSGVFAEKCSTNVGTFGVRFGSEKAYKKEKLKEAKAQFSEIAKYNKFVTHLYYGSTNVLCKELTKPLTEVRYVKFENFGIKEIQAGAFHEIPYLTFIELYDNNIRTIKTGIFNKLNVTKIILDKNAISEIETSAFDNMPYLNILSIEQNKITIINPNWFYDTTNLYSLYLDENKISEIPKNAFKNIIKGHDCNLELEETRCPDIWLQFNRIKKIHPEAFQSLGKIVNLMIGSNELTEIPNAFTNLQIQTLSIEFNDLACINNDILDTLKHTTRLYIGSNLLTKECIDKFQKFKENNHTLEIVYKNVRIDDEDDD